MTVTTKSPRNTHPAVGVVIPCFRVKNQILSVISSIPSFVDHIYVVDDACPEQTGQYVSSSCLDKRIQVLRHARNLGVGGAMITGFRKAIADGCDIVAKLDGDGQMDGRLLPAFISPIARQQADYTKGNRFYTVESVHQMPKGRLIGNLLLSFMTKMSSGYWHIFDPTNGFICISVPVLKLLPLEKISQGYFFESDMLFRLNTVRALVMDIPMKAIYADEESNLSFLRNALPFIGGHCRNLLKRIAYSYFLRNFSIASLELVFGLLLFFFGFGFGLYEWGASIATGHPATTGTVMLAALPLILGFQLLMSFISYDVASQPTHPISTFLSEK